MTELPELDLMHKDLAGQPDHCRPTAFWQSAIEPLVTELRAGAFEKFRSLDVSLRYFVPTYGSPGNGIASQRRDLLDSCERILIGFCR